MVCHGLFLSQKTCTRISTACSRNRIGDKRQPNQKLRQVILLVLLSSGLFFNLQTPSVHYFGFKSTPAFADDSTPSHSPPPFVSVSTSKGFETKLPAEKVSAQKNTELSKKTLSTQTTNIPAASPPLAFDNLKIDQTPTGSIDDGAPLSKLPSKEDALDQTYDDGLSLPISAIPDPLGASARLTANSSVANPSSQNEAMPQTPAANLRYAHPTISLHHTVNSAWPKNAPKPFYRQNIAENPMLDDGDDHLPAYPHLAQAAISALPMAAFNLAQRRSAYVAPENGFVSPAPVSQNWTASPQSYQNFQSRQTRAPARAAPAVSANYAIQPRGTLDPKFVRQEVALNPNEFGFQTKPGEIVIDTEDKFLFLIMPNGRALRYGIGVGRPGFLWAGTKHITHKAEWPDWTPPDEMLLRRPDLPRHMKGGIENPLGARALYLGSSLYRIHGTNEPSTIGHNVSSGCIRLTNEDVTDLYQRVKVGTTVVVLP